MVINAGSQSLCLLLARAVIGVEQVLNHAAHNSTQAPLVAQQVLYMGKGSLCSNPEDHSHSTLRNTHAPWADICPRVGPAMRSAITNWWVDVGMLGLKMTCIMLLA